MNKVKNILVLQSRIEILVTVPGLGHGVPVCGFHTRPFLLDWFSHIRYWWVRGKTLEYRIIQNSLAYCTK